MPDDTAVEEMTRERLIEIALDACDEQCRQLGWLGNNTMRARIVEGTLVEVERRAIRASNSPEGT